MDQTLSTCSSVIYECMPPEVQCQSQGPPCLPRDYLDIPIECPGPSFAPRCLRLCATCEEKWLIWGVGAVAGAIFYSDIFSNSINIINGGASRINEQGEASFALRIEEFILLGLIYWIALQLIGVTSSLLPNFLLAWSTSLFFFSLLPYWVALPLWLAVSLIFFCI